MKTTWAFTLITLASAIATADQPWRTEVLYQSNHGFSGAAIGDLDPALAGNEVAVVNELGEAWLIGRDGAQWQAQRIHAGGGEMIMAAIGDVDPQRPGNEFVGAGMAAGRESEQGAGQLTLVHKEGDQWKSEVLYRDERLLHGVAIGDVCAAHPGAEVIAASFTHRVQLLCRDGDRFQPETIYVANDRLKIVLAADVLPDRPGLEVLATGGDGRPQVLWEGNLGWRHETLFEDAFGQSRITCGEGGVLVGGDGGKVTLMRRREGRWQSEFLGRDTAKIRGVVLADIDPRVPGVEAYACGYSGNVTQYTQTSAGFWRSRVLYSDPRSLHHLLVGEFDARHEGVELVTCGHGGRVIGLYPGE